MMPRKKINILPKLEIFTKPSRYKVCYGGRGAGRSWGVARLLIARAAAHREKILCCREFQRSIDASVLTLLREQIGFMELEPIFEIQRNRIICTLTGSEFIFEGIAQNVTKIKSMEGVTVVWVEEAESLTAGSWDVLIPTIRADKSEIWITFNPAFDMDPTYVRFVENAPPESLVVKANYHDNPWFPEELRKEMEYLKKSNYEAYEHIWLGKPKSSRPGAYFGEQILAMQNDGRITKVPHDPILTVQCSFDLGIMDSTVVWFFQRQGSGQVLVINCLEFKGTGLPDIIRTVKELPYNISQWIAPHDIAVRDFGSGDSRLHIAQGLGVDFDIAPKRSVADGIEATKALLPKCWIDKTNCEKGIKALKLYHSEYNEERQVFSTKPVHDFCSDFADSFRYFAITPPRTETWGYSGAINYPTTSNHI